MNYKALHTALLMGAVPLLLMGAATNFWVPLNAYRLWVLRPIEKRAYPEEYKNVNSQEEGPTEVD